MGLKERARQLRVDIPAVFIALKRKDTPIAAKALAGIVVAYALSPIDLVPDFIPVLGYLDDLIILPALIALVVRLIPSETFDECRREAQGMWEDGKPKRWYYALPIVAVWLLVVAVVVKLVWFN